MVGQTRFRPNLSALAVAITFFSCFWICQASLGERALPQLTDSGISTLVSITDPVKNLDPHNPSSHLAKILIPRVPDTPNNTFVGNYIISTLKDLGWHIDLDEFSDKTPIGVKRFRNIIATKDPNAARRVVLAAHYDSKYFPSYPENQFVGATDSAAPCAILLDLAEALNPLFAERQQRLQVGNVEDEEVAETTLQLVFFDGEEAFGEWTHTDSLYGARHLAAKWEVTYHAPHDRRRLGMDSTELSGIEHLILLDLLGAPQPLIRSYYLETGWLFDALQSVETRLGNSGAFVYGNNNLMAANKWTPYFLERKRLQNTGYIEDDHLPFLQKGVSILHLITEPFPVVWHTIKDDASALDIPTMRRWNIIMRVFMAEYLHLRPENVHKGLRREDLGLVHDPAMLSQVV